MGEMWKEPLGRKTEFGIYNFHVIQKADQFKSNVTGESYKIRQKLNCNSENVIQLIECKSVGNKGSDPQRIYI